MNNKTKKKKGKGRLNTTRGHMNSCDLAMINIQKLIDQYEKSDRENLDELNNKINDAITNYTNKTNLKKMELIKKLEENFYCII